MHNADDAHDPSRGEIAALDRREFLKATGSLVIGFSAAETLAAQSSPAVGAASRLQTALTISRSSQAL